MRVRVPPPAPSAYKQACARLSDPSTHADSRGVRCAESLTVLWGGMSISNQYFNLLNPSQGPRNLSTARACSEDPKRSGNSGRYPLPQGQVRVASK